MLGDGHAFRLERDPTEVHYIFRAREVVADVWLTGTVQPESDGGGKLKYARENTVDAVDAEALRVAKLQLSRLRQL